jgi:SAM-dependent methyltransferase
MNLAPPSIRARSFDAWAGDYERYRPGYPAALLDLVGARLHLPTEPDAVDLGSGTGKVARAIAARGWQVTAVEPGSGMLAVLRDQAEREGLTITLVHAPAEATGLPDRAFDVALAGEAYHWFDAPVALAEIARIVRPEGGIAFFWNVIDGDGFDLIDDERRLVAEHGIAGPEALARPGMRVETADAIRATGRFDEAEFHQVRYVRRLTGAEYIGLARTKSHLRTAAPEVQAAFVRAFEGMLAGRGFGPDDPIEVPYVVDCWIARRNGT